MARHVEVSDLMPYHFSFSAYAAGFRVMEAWWGWGQVTSKSDVIYAAGKDEKETAVIGEAVRHVSAKFDLSLSSLGEMTGIQRVRLPWS